MKLCKALPQEPENATATRLCCVQLATCVQKAHAVAYCARLFRYKNATELMKSIVVWEKENKKYVRYRTCSVGGVNKRQNCRGEW